MIQVKYSDSIKQCYYDLIAKTKMKKYGNKTFESYYNQYIKSKLNYELKDLLCGDFEKLLEIKEKIGTKFSSKNNIIKQLFNYDKSDKSLKLKISKLQPKISKFFRKNITVHTCYYCNIDFINKFNTKNEVKDAFTLDHFLDKGKYPYLALSLYNLVPSCYVCNSKIKKTKEINTLSPTSKNFDFDKRVKFKTFMQSQNLIINTENDFTLLLKEDFSKIYEEYIDSLELNGRYEYHKYKVLEMIEKRKTYPDSRIKELALLSQKTEEEVKQDLFGEYLENELHKRPLSKLIKDIVKELGLLK